MEPQCSVSDLGFDETHFIDDFDQTKLLREYITDRETVSEKIIDRYESRAANEDLFIMSISMQNHGGYTESTIILMRRYACWD